MQQVHRLHFVWQGARAEVLRVGSMDYCILKKLVSAIPMTSEEPENTHLETFIQHCRDTKEPNFVFYQSKTDWNKTPGPCPENL